MWQVLSRIQKYEINKFADGTRIITPKVILFSMCVTLISTYSTYSFKILNWTGSLYHFIGSFSIIVGSTCTSIMYTCSAAPSIIIMRTFVETQKGSSVCFIWKRWRKIFSPLCASGFNMKPLYSQRPDCHEKSAGSQNSRHTCSQVKVFTLRFNSSMIAFLRGMSFIT